MKQGELDEHLVDLFARFQALDKQSLEACKRIGSLTPETPEICEIELEIREIELEICLVVKDFIEICYPLVRNRANAWRNIGEPEELAADVILSRLYPRADRIMWNTTNIAPGALVHTEIKFALLDLARKHKPDPRRDDRDVSMIPNLSTGLTPEDIVLGDLDRNARKELACLETELVAGGRVCVFHPPDNRSAQVDHRLVLSVLREWTNGLSSLGSRTEVPDGDAHHLPLPSDLDLKSLRNTIKLRSGIPDERRNLLSHRHYRCLDWFLYRIAQGVDSHHLRALNGALAKWVKLDPKEAVWDRKATRREARILLYQECPGVHNLIDAYLFEQETSGRITNDDVRRLVAELEMER